MSYRLISLALPKETLALGIGTMVGWPFLEKAYLELGEQGSTELLGSNPAHFGRLK